MTKNLAVVFLSLAFVMPGVSHAARDYGSNPLDYGGQVYLTVKYSEITIAVDVPESGSEIRNLGFVFGGSISDNWALELEYSTTVSVDDNYGGGNNGSAEVNSLGVFLVGRTPGDLYLKGRLGYTRTEQIFGPIEFTQLEGSRNIYGVAVGVAAGFKFTQGGALELEYMLYPTRDDVTFDTTPIGGPIFDEDLEMDFVSLNYVMSFE